MEDVLRVYARPPDPARPLVCFDESGKDLKKHKRPPRLPAPTSSSGWRPILGSGR
jgi:hypothetical protein